MNYLQRSMYSLVEFLREEIIAGEILDYWITLIDSASTYNTIKSLNSHFSKMKRRLAGWLIIFCFLAILNDFKKSSVYH